MNNRTNHPPNLKVLIGGAHPEGRLDESSRARIKQEADSLMEDAALASRAEELEDMYYRKGEAITEECNRYALLYTSLKTGKHISFIELQNDILNRGRQGETEVEIARHLYDGFMDCLATSIEHWASFYRKVPFDPEAFQSD